MFVRPSVRVSRWVHDWRHLPRMYSVMIVVNCSKFSVTDHHHLRGCPQSGGSSGCFCLQLINFTAVFALEL